MPNINVRTPVAQAASHTSNVSGTPATTLDALRKPTLNASDIAPATDALQQVRQSVGTPSINRALQGIPASPEEMRTMRRDVGALSQLAPVPGTVSGKRQWVEKNRPIIEKGQEAAFNLRQEAFFVDKNLRGEADAATASATSARSQLERVEEQAGLRVPQPPLDPNRPYGQLTQSFQQGRQANPIFRAISPLLLPAIGIGDFADAIGRGAERQAYPDAMKDYKARLAEYEKARAQ